MKSSSLRLTAGLILLLTGSAAAQSNEGQREPPPIVADAKNVIDLLEAGHFDQVTDYWTSDMLEQLPEPKVREFWTGLVAQAGRLQSIGTPEIKAEGGYQTVVIPLAFERAQLEASVTYDGQGKVAGIYFRPKS